MVRRARMHVENLSRRRELLGTIARWHFELWGILTGSETLSGYVKILERCATSTTIPSVLIALSDAELLGSVSLVACDMTIRPDLTPWLAQLFVSPLQRSRGVGAALVRAALDHARQCGFKRVYLYTSGTLPDYYTRLGWSTLERVEYLGKERTVMEHGVGGAS